MEFIDLKAQYKELKTEIDANIQKVLAHGRYLMGPEVGELEQQLAEYVGVKHCITCANGTDALHMVLMAWGIKEGDAVFVPTFTFMSTAEVVSLVGATPVFTDINLKTFNMDAASLEQQIEKVIAEGKLTPKAIIPVDLAGIPCNYEKIYEIVNSKKSIFKPANKIQQAIGRIAVCADSAHAFGAQWHNKLVGSIADFTSFSFHAVKNFTTAEGGAATWKTIPGIDDEELYKEYQLYSLHGQSKDALAKTQLGAWEYDIKGTYYKCNMTDIMAAIGLVQFKRYPQLLARRKEIIEKYNDGLKDSGVEVLQHYTDEWQSSGHLYLVRLLGKDEAYRNKFIIKMAERGIATNVHYKPLPMHTAYKNLGFDDSL